MKQQNENILYSHPELNLNIKELTMYPNNLYRNIHFHNEVEMIKVTSGKIICHIDNTEIIMSQDEILIINSNVLHKLSAYSTESKITYMQIGILHYENILFDNNDLDKKLFPIAYISQNQPKYKLFSSSSEISDIFMKILYEINNKQSYYKQYIQTSIFHLVSFMHRHNLLLRNSINTDKRLNKIFPALHFIQENLTDKMSLDDICRTVNIDKFYFCKLFKAITGYTITSYTNTLRINLAQKLIIESKNNIGEIAYDTGFSSTQHFNKVFKSITGCTPKEYKKYFNNNL